MYSRTEQEIMQNWNGDIDAPVVSVCCTTYNHENYIAEAIKGFLMQETDFPFEIRIRDDCSIDKTAEIVKEYADKYPQLIKPIFEKENTFSKGVKPMPQLYKIAKGKYIALCEGDDYWTDPFKLQQQINEMEKHSDIGISFHLCSSLDSQGKLTNPILQKINRIYTIEEIIKGDFHLVQTNTVVFKKESLNHLGLALLSNSPVGDVWIRIAASIPNGAIFINKIMSTYRVQSIGSWSKSMQEGKTFLLFVNKMMKSIDEFDKYWEYKYTKEFNVYKNKFIKAVMQKNNISTEETRAFLNTYESLLTMKDVVSWHLIYKYKLVSKMVRTIKQTLRNWIKK